VPVQGANHYDIYHIHGNRWDYVETVLDPPATVPQGAPGQRKWQVKAWSALGELLLVLSN